MKYVNCGFHDTTLTINWKRHGIWVKIHKQHVYLYMLYRQDEFQKEVEMTPQTIRLEICVRILLVLLLSN